jgi:cytochrome c556
MKLHVVVIALVGAVVMLAVFACTSPDKEVVSSNSTLPASLDQYYPPKSPEPVWFLSMLGMAQPLTASMADVFENDFDNAQKGFEAFKKVYVDISKMVPEWTERFPIGPIDKLGEAIASKDIGRIMAEAGNLDAVCHNCHIQNMVPVQQKYRWPDFLQIGLTDPITNQDVNWKMLMMMMETAFTGIGSDLAQGQPDQARAQFQAFSARFNAISVACMTCHDTGRKYYVSSDVTEMIDQVGSELNQPTIDVEKVNALLQGIGMESCVKCHMVHVPASYGKQAMAASH